MVSVKRVVGLFGLGIFIQTFCYAEKIYEVTLNDVSKHPNHEQLAISKPAESIQPGELGSGVLINEDMLDEETLKSRIDMNDLAKIDVFASDLIPADRSLPDFRTDWCKAKYTSTDRQELGTASVIICSCNEVKSLLKRTVTSVVNRTPKQLLEEIIILDDASDQNKFDIQAETKGMGAKIRVFHNPERLGAAGCRQHGVTKANGDVLVFLDSHVEVTDGWLEPLLHEIAQDERVMAAPSLDHIHPNALTYNFNDNSVFGMIKFNLDMMTYSMGEEEKKAKEDYFAPHTTPMMFKTIFAVKKSWFGSLIGFDSYARGSGETNLDISIMNWLAGGSVKIIPCSRVGHVDGWGTRYQETDRDVKYNRLRIADMWLEDFKFIYFDRVGYFNTSLVDKMRRFGKLDSKTGEYEGMIMRKVQKMRAVNAKDIDYWLKDVANNAMPTHRFLASGQIRNPATNLCLDQHDGETIKPIYLTECTIQHDNQFFWFDLHHRFIRDFRCVVVEDDDLHFKFDDCTRVRGAFWYNEETQEVTHNGKCLAVGITDNVYTAHLTKCSEKHDDPNQKWVMNNYHPNMIHYHELVSRY